MLNNEKMPVQSFDENEEIQVTEEEVQGKGDSMSVNNEGNLVNSRLEVFRSRGLVPLSFESIGTGMLSNEDIDVVHGWLADGDIPQEAKKKFLEQRALYANERVHEDPNQSYVMWDPKTSSFYKLERI